MFSLFFSSSRLWPRCEALPGPSAPVKPSRQRPRAFVWEAARFAAPGPDRLGVPPGCGENRREIPGQGRLKAVAARKKQAARPAAAPFFRKCARAPRRESGPGSGRRPQRLRNRPANCLRSRRPHKYALYRSLHRIIQSPVTAVKRFGPKAPGGALPLFAPVVEISRQPPQESLFLAGETAQ